jgi:hypothetical protein
MDSYHWEHPRTILLHTQHLNPVANFETLRAIPGDQVAFYQECKLDENWRSQNVGCEL